MGFRVVVVMLIVALFSIQSVHAGRPGFTAAMSIIPGLGQMTEGDTIEGLGWFFASLIPMGSKSADIRQIGFGIWQYNIYDAYRVGGGAKADKQNVLSHYVAAFNPVNGVDPIGGSMVGAGLVLGYKNRYPVFKKPYKIPVYGVVGLGEEALFRGVLFPEFSALLSSKWLGAAFSSAAFSAAHYIGGPENIKASPLIQRFILGMFFCWQMDRNQYDLNKSIFAHAWYDILVDTDSANISGLQVHLPF